MAETHITRCPHCQTTFRLRLEQLAAAKGAVRCGSCLQVFKAADHLVSDTKKAAKAKKI
ncbi:MAG: zinc-ribbon domain-containing protein, partial [Oleispira sp.]|nr:zinc-ribbon domain-containing protein [Oleispira sp.]